MNANAMSATKLRLLLIIGMVLLGIASIAGFYVAQAQLMKYANEISTLNATAQTGNESLQTLRTLEAKVNEERAAIAKARSIVSESKQYLYQDQIVNDISRIAGDSGISITQFDFAGSQQTGATTTPAAGGATTTSPTDMAGSSASGLSTLKSETVTVSVKSPASYTSLMNFIKAIEQNPTKMQIANISMTAETSDRNKVSSQTFIIKVYVR